MTVSRREQGASQPQIPKNDTSKRWIRRGGLVALGAGAIYLAQGEGEKPTPSVESKITSSSHREPIRVTHPREVRVENSPESQETQTFNLGDIPLVREGFDVYDENRLSWDIWKDEEAKRETLAIYHNLLTRVVVDQSDDAIHIYIPGATDLDLLVTPGQANGSQLGLTLAEYGRPTFQTPEMDPEGAADRIESFVSDAIMHEAKHLYTEKYGEQPMEGILDEYEHDHTSGGSDEANSEE